MLKMFFGRQIVGHDSAMKQHRTTHERVVGVCAVVISNTCYVELNILVLNTPKTVPKYHPYRSDSKTFFPDIHIYTFFLVAYLRGKSFAIY